ncbi:MAG: hypothetical protein ACKOC4_05060, partial [Planctomycetia bacterium]
MPRSPKSAAPPRPASRSVRAAAAKPAPAVAPDLAQARAVVLDLLAIPGVSGNEHAVAARIVKWLRGAGCPAAAIAFDKAHEKTPLKGECGNLIVQLPGTLPGPRRLLMAHMDTVPVCL